MNRVLLLGTLCPGRLAVAAENALTVRVLPTCGGHGPRGRIPFHRGETRLLRY